MQSEIGDTVLLPEFGGDSVHVNKNWSVCEDDEYEYVLYKDKGILAKIED